MDREALRLYFARRMPSAWSERWTVLVAQKAGPARLGELRPYRTMSTKHGA